MCVFKAQSEGWELEGSLPSPVSSQSVMTENKRENISFVMIKLTLSYSFY